MILQSEIVILRVGNQPQIIRTRREAFAWAQAQRAAGRRLGIVPTMGALHQGHLSLLQASLAECDDTILTIFVNPTQFGPHEDFDRYPRDLSADLGLLADEGLDVAMVFAPTTDEMYGPHHATSVRPAAVATRWEGAHRPDHFEGVATIVLKLFLTAPAHQAYFGQKDFQQVAVIRAMVRDLDVPIQITSCATVREEDGLAMSSRNRYLSPGERTSALAIHRSLQQAVRAVADGQQDTKQLIDGMRKTLTGAGIEKIDYVAVVDPDTLEPLRQIDNCGVALIAAHVGTTRLIDNAVLMNAIHKNAIHKNAVPKD